MSAADRRRQIEDLCHSALERDPAARAAFVATACGGDDALRREVEALLAHAQTAEGFLSMPLDVVAAGAFTNERGVSLVGRSLGAYHILSFLGQGGMGEVYQARDTTLNRDVALKILPSNVSLDSDRVARFKREAQLLASLNHPNIAAIYGFVEHDEIQALVLELVQGETLADRLARGPIPVADALIIGRQIADALDAAHEKGVVHRDLKPPNVMLTAHGHVKILDFGLAKQLAIGSGQHTASTTLELTLPGTRLGTPSYMSPEQILGAPLDPRSDIFSLGTILYELATCAHPFLRSTSADTMAAILREPPRGGSRDLECVPGLARVVTRMLAKACGERYQTVSALRAELDALRERASSSTPSAGAASGSPLEAPERTPFVARESELSELRKMLDRMLLGQGGVVLLGGEPGVGKTRLAREIQRLGRERGCMTLSGGCYEEEGSPPFGPFVEIMEHAARTLPQAVRAALGDSAPEIAAIVPGLRRVYDDIPPQAVVPVDQQRRLLFSAYLEYVRRATLKSAGVVLFDDLHWGDESTLQLLMYLAPHLSTMRLLLVGTYRDVELDAERPFARALEVMLRQRHVIRMHVRRLNHSDVGTLLHAMRGSAPPSSLARAVYEETDGNAFFVEEVVQHLSEEGKLFDAEGRWNSDLRADQIDVPQSVRLVISRRLARLSEQTRKVLTAAGIVGRAFPLDILEVIVDLPEDAVFDAIEEAERAQLVAPEASRAARYGFVHELIRSTLINGVSLPRRQRFHLRIADALEHQYADRVETHASLLAHHLYRAGAAADESRTVRHLGIAARQACASCAFEEALVLLDQLADADTSAAEAADVEELRAQALFGLGRLNDGLAPLRRAFDVWRRIRDDAGITRTALALDYCYTWQEQSARCLDALRAGLEALSADAIADRCLLQALLSRWLVSPENYAEGQALLREAEHTARTLGDPRRLGEVLTAKVFACRSVSDFHGVFPAAHEALALFDRADVWRRAEVGYALVTTLLYAGRFAELEAEAAELHEAARRAGHYGALWIVMRAQINRDLAISGDLEAFRSRSEPDDQGSVQFRFLTLTTFAVATFYGGDVEHALRILKTANDHRSRAFAFAKGVAEANVFAYHAYLGQVAAARDAFDTARSVLAQPGRVNAWGRWLATIAVVPGLALIGARQECGSLYAVTRESFQTGMSFETLTIGPNSPQLSAAIAAHAAGLTDAATEHFEAALQHADALPHRLLQPTVKYWYGRTLLDRGDADDVARGRAMLRRALDEFRALKMPLHQQLTQRACASAP